MAPPLPAAHTAPVPKRIAIFAALISITAAVFWISRSDQPTPQEPIAGAGSDSPRVNPVPSPVPTSPALDALGIVRAEFQTALAQLRSGSDAERAASILNTLAARLRALDRDIAAILLQEILATGSDTDLPIAFAIGQDGHLTGAPSFRVWLLDQLGQIHPEAAADNATRILAAPGSADEWAIALRSFLRVRQAPADRAFASGKLRELLGNTRWRREQSIGWLEAFDAVVHLHAVDLTPDIAALVTRTDPKDKPAAHAAYLTLDRLVQVEPAKMLAKIIDSPDLMKGRELTRASYFARADVSDPTQRELLERYLLDPSRSREELAKFAGLYPNATLMISNNLLTKVTPPDRDQVAARDRVALWAVEKWAADPRFAAVRGQLETIQRRLSISLQPASPQPIREN